MPRFLQLGLESDNYATKRRSWDPSDSNTWQQQQQTPTKSLAGHQKPDEDAYSSRYRRRQLLEEQAWNRIRGDHPQQQAQRQQRHSPKRTTQEETAARSPMQFDNSPWSRMQREPQQPAEVPPVVNSAPAVPATTNSSSSIPAEVASTATLPPLPPSSSSSGIARRTQLITHSPPKTVLKQPQQKKPVEQLQKGSNSKEETPASTPAPSPNAPSESSIPRPPPRASKPASPTATTPASAAASTPAPAETSNSTGPQTAPAAPKANSEERELDQRVANIRKEYEKRQEEQQKTILQIQQRVRAHRMPIDVASAADASSEEEEEEEDEDEDTDDKDGESIPVHVYPKPVHDVPSQPETPERKDSTEEVAVSRLLHVSTSDVPTSATSNVAEIQRKFSYPFGKPVPQNATIDWKKYLIPSPPDSAKNRRPTAAAASSSAVSEIVQRSADTSTSIPRFTDSRSFNTDESTWNERRRRFVRSKTNPDFSFDLNQVTPTETPRVNRYLPDPGETEQRRRRFGYRSDSTGNQENSNTNTVSGREASEPRGAAKTRYRRKAERSHSGYVVNSTNGGQNDENDHYHSAEPQRFEISIGGNNDSSTNNAASAPGARFYRVFTNPKIDYLSKGRNVLKFGCKGNGDGQFNWPRGVACVPTTEEIVGK